MTDPRDPADCARQRRRGSVNSAWLLFLGSSCIYPKFAAQPISEDSLLTGPLEETNDAYAVASTAVSRPVTANGVLCWVGFAFGRLVDLVGGADGLACATTFVAGVLGRVAGWPAANAGPAAVAAMRAAAIDSQAVHRARRRRQALLWGATAGARLPLPGTRAVYPGPSK